MGQYGRIMIYTLIDGHADAFDRLAAEVARAVRQAEPGTLVYACHTVDNAPDQRFFYQLFRDANSVEAHTRQPHVQRFAQRGARARQRHQRHRADGQRRPTSPRPRGHGTTAPAPPSPYGWPGMADTAPLARASSCSASRAATCATRRAR